MTPSENDDAIFEEEDFEDDEKGLTIDELGKGFLKTPKVGEAPLIFKVKKIVQLSGNQLTVKKKEGGTFSKALSKIDKGYEIVTSENQRYTISTWEVFGKIKAIFRKLGKIDGVEISLTHIRDGMLDRNSKADCYEIKTLINGEWKFLDRKTNEWK